MIHTITLFEKITLMEEDKNGPYVLPFPTFGDIHCVGYYSSIDAAQQAVKLFGNMLYDEMYNYCIIEEYEEGILKHSVNRYLYKWNSDKYEYEQIDEPININKVTNFAMS